MQSKRLRLSAKDAPYCFYCFAPNQFDENGVGQLLCLAHSNELRHGRGAYHKSDDIFGAIVCKACHWKIDGVVGHLSKEEKHDMHYRAHVNTLKWWWNTGRITVAA